MLNGVKWWILFAPSTGDFFNLILGLVSQRCTYLQNIITYDDRAILYHGNSCARLESARHPEQTKIRCDHEWNRVYFSLVVFSTSHHPTEVIEIFPLAHDPSNCMNYVQINSFAFLRGTSLSYLNEQCRWSVYYFLLLRGPIGRSLELYDAAAAAVTALRDCC